MSVRWWGCPKRFSRRWCCGWSLSYCMILLEVAGRPLHYFTARLLFTPIPHLILFPHIAHAIVAANATLDSSYCPSIIMCHIKSKHERTSAVFIPKWILVQLHASLALWQLQNRWPDVSGRAGSRPRQVRPRPKAPPKNKIFLEEKGPTFHS